MAWLQAPLRAGPPEADGPTVELATHREEHTRAREAERDYWEPTVTQEEVFTVRDVCQRRKWLPIAAVPAEASLIQNEGDNAYTKRVNQAM